MTNKDPYLTEVIKDFDVESYVMPEALKEEIKEWQDMEPVGNEFW